MCFYISIVNKIVVFLSEIIELNYTFLKLDCSNKFRVLAHFSHDLQSSSFDTGAETQLCLPIRYQNASPPAFYRFVITRDKGLRVRVAKLHLLSRHRRHSFMLHLVVEIDPAFLSLATIRRHWRVYLSASSLLRRASISRKLVIVSLILPLSMCLSLSLTWLLLSLRSVLTCSSHLSSFMFIVHVGLVADVRELLKVERHRRHLAELWRGARAS